MKEQVEEACKMLENDIKNEKVNLLEAAWPVTDHGHVNQLILASAGPESAASRPPWS